MAKRRLTGVVTKTKMQETAVVSTTQIKVHPLYHKRYRIQRRFAAHNPENTYQVGDQVRIEEHRPMAKTKHWLIIERITKAAAVAEQAVPDREIEVLLEEAKNTPANQADGSGTVSTETETR